MSDGERKVVEIGCGLHKMSSGIAKIELYPTILEFSTPSHKSL
jgi:hypothetical protein